MTLSRRRLFQAAASAVVLSSCKRKLPEACTDTSGLSSDEIQARTVLAYGDASPFPDKTCAGCQQYVAPAKSSDGDCGACKVLKGPIHPRGYCKSFARLT